MHKFSTAATKSSVVLCAPTAFRDPHAGAPGLLTVADSTFAGASDPQAGAPEASSTYSPQYVEEADRAEPSQGG